MFLCFFSIFNNPLACFHQDWWFAVLQIQMWSDSQTVSGVSNWWSWALLYFSSPSWLFWSFCLSSLLRASVTLRGHAFMCCSSSLKVSRVQTRKPLLLWLSTEIKVEVDFLRCDRHVFERFRSETQWEKERGAPTERLTGSSSHYLRHISGFVPAGKVIMNHSLHIYLFWDYGLHYWFHAIANFPNQPGAGLHNLPSTVKTISL